MRRYRYVILGGGVAAGYAAAGFAERGIWPGELAILSADSDLPYERPPLSKGFLAGAEEAASLFIRDPDFYPRQGIAVPLDTPVERLDMNSRSLYTRSGAVFEFEQLLIATGAQPRTLRVPGAARNGVCYLRSLADAKRLRAQIGRAERAVVIGAGFIGMEVSAILAQQGLATTLVFPGERVWERLFTPPMSAFFQRYFRERGVTLVPGARVAAVEGGEDVSGVLLSSGERLAADLVVAGIGVEPATAPLEGCGLLLRDGVVVNEFLETNLEGVYAAGDVASFPDAWSAQPRRVEHWDNAVAQGRHAARVLLGERVPFDHLPYFFSDVFDLSYEFWGDASGAQRVVHRGEVETGRFSTWWLKGGRVVAAFALNCPEEERNLAAEWVKARWPAAPDLLQNPRRPLTKNLAPAGDGLHAAGLSSAAT